MEIIDFENKNIPTHKKIIGQTGHNTEGNSKITLKVELIFFKKKRLLIFKTKYDSIPEH